MTTKEMIEVLQAFEDGKEIERINNLNPNAFGWVLDKKPNWDFQSFSFRIKPEPPKPEYVPFTLDDRELFADKLIKSGNNFYRIIGFNMSDITTQRSNYGYARALEVFTFADGTPFGKIKE